MKRTKWPAPTEEKVAKHINLIRKLAWVFHELSGIEWGELFSEASIAYCEAITTYNPAKNTKESSWIYICIQNQLKNFCKYESRNIYGSPVLGNINTSDPDYEFFEDHFKELSKDVVIIMKMVQKNPNRYNRKKLTNRKGVGHIRKDLRRIKNWQFGRINQAMQDLRLELIN